MSMNELTNMFTKASMKKHTQPTRRAKKESKAVPARATPKRTSKMQVNKPKSKITKVASTKKKPTKVKTQPRSLSSNQKLANVLQLLSNSGKPLSNKQNYVRKMHYSKEKANKYHAKHLEATPLTKHEQKVYNKFYARNTDPLANLLSKMTM
jgi:hypothetical protein